MSPALCGVMVRLRGLRSSLRGLQFRSGNEGVTLAGKPCKYDTIQFIAKTCTSHICKPLSMHLHTGPLPSCGSPHNLEETHRTPSCQDLASPKPLVLFPLHHSKTLADPTWGKL